MKTKYIVNDTLTEQQAKAMAATEWWKEKTPKEIVAFQLFTRRMCMPWGEFREAVEKALSRPVYTHDFAFADKLRDEFLGERLEPTMEEIIG